MQSWQVLLTICFPVTRKGAPPQTRNDTGPRNAEGRQVNLEGSSPGMAMNGNKEADKLTSLSPSVPMKCGSRPKPSSSHSASSGVRPHHVQASTSSALQSSSSEFVPSHENSVVSVVCLTPFLESVCFEHFHRVRFLLRPRLSASQCHWLATLVDVRSAGQIKPPAQAASRFLDSSQMALMPNDAD